MHGHQSFQGAVLWGWLKRFPMQFISFMAWLRRGLAAMDGKERPHADSPEVLSFSLSMMGTLTQDVSSAASTKDGDRRGERWNVWERAKTLPPA